ncbi:PREDICTED: exocyst complex component 2-like isoform X2 [Priapulus caudatus]|uniref:Exocyst complex component 2 n=1 Tax=Priapulus caudatus TaxID=37621 RepID=A0ABM1DWF2_PRICU|nr:PREDICTED: exocyst complex component 2-like isoform X2 [Priapulus caudatus]
MAVELHGKGKMLHTNRQAEPPKVTGLSPKEGPPGTKIIIRGENLGVNPQDVLALRICGVECVMTMEWMSSSKLVARTGPCKGVGDVIILTKSGGIGTCTVKFRGFFVQTGPLQESAVWVDESRLFDKQKSRRVQSPIVSQEDPLGLSDEATHKKISEHELVELFPEGSGNLNSDDFVAQWFLVENHQGSSFDDLKAGLTHMQRRRTHTLDGPASLVKDNLDSFTECINTLTSLQGMIMSDQRASEGHLTDQAEVILSEALGMANDLFQDVLKRRDRADTIRNALNVLLRFKFLFSLPGSIEKNIQRGDIEIVINDWSRAKSLFSDTRVKIFTNVYDDVEQRIQALQQKLTNKLSQIPAPLEEQKRLIMYLNGLETAGNPAWLCISNHHDWITSTMVSCQVDHIKAENQGSEDQPEIIKTVFGIAGYTTGGHAGGQGSESVAARFRTPQRVLFVEELTEILMQHLPDMYKLGQSYLAGELKNITSSRYGKEDSTAFTAMMHDVLEMYCNLLRAALVPNSLKSAGAGSAQQLVGWQTTHQEMYTDWIPHCVRYVRSCYSSLRAMDLAGDLTGIVERLVSDMRIQCMAALFQKASEEIRCLYLQEDWVLDVDDTTGATTNLPQKYENIVLECLQILQDVLTPSVPGEQEILTNRASQKDLSTMCVNLLQSFIPTLQKLTSKDVEKRCKASQAEFLTQTGEELPNTDVRLLIVLANCNLIVSQILPRLIESFDKYGYPAAGEIHEAVKLRFEDLNTKLISAYVERRADPIVGAIEQNMYIGHFSWTESFKPSEVSGYLKELLFSMVAIHAEVHATSPASLYVIMSRSLQAIAGELARLFSCVTRFSEGGAQQACLDLIGLQGATMAYQSATSKTCFTEAMACLPEKSANDEVSGKLMDKFKRSMKFQLICFQGELIKM